MECANWAEKSNPTPDPLLPLGTFRNWMTYEKFRVLRSLAWHKIVSSKVLFLLKKYKGHILESYFEAIDFNNS